jgi:uncharacterized metal-binding protein
VSLPPFWSGSPFSKLLDPPLFTTVMKLAQNFLIGDSMPIIIIIFFLLELYEYVKRLCTMLQEVSVTDTINTNYFMIGVTRNTLMNVDFIIFHNVVISQIRRTYEKIIYTWKKVNVKCKRKREISRCSQ